jgi:tRNA pseudouridine38-40 synthase
MSRFRLDLAYDGSDFYGWAAQPGRRTVQGVLEDWINTILGHEYLIPIVVAGRTDHGVHAHGQVAHFDVPDELDERALALGPKLRRVLPDDIYLHSLVAAHPDFDARFSATYRRYCYRLWDTDSRPDPMLRKYIVPVPDSLDVKAMHDGGQLLLGLRSFAPFCRASEGRTAIRTLQRCDVERADSQWRTVQIHVQADAFCRNMVRSLAGALVMVGAGRRDLEWLVEIASLDQRAGEVTVMPSHGLTLEEVGYPPPDGLAARAERARNKRTLEGQP